MLYPVMLNIAGQKAVVVGGGAVAVRKARSLIDAGAVVKVISPEVSEAMNELLSGSTISWQKKEFAPADIKDAFLVIAATNSRETNELVQQSASPCQLINLTDDPQGSRFIVPASFQRDKLCIAVSTHGASPALSKRIIRELKEQFNDADVAYIAFLEKCRTVIKQALPASETRQLLLKQLASPGFEKQVKAASSIEREQLLTEMLTDWREKQ